MSDKEIMIGRLLDWPSIPPGERWTEIPSTSLRASHNATQKRVIQEDHLGQHQNRDKGRKASETGDRDRDEKSWQEQKEGEVIVLMQLNELKYRAKTDPDPIWSERYSVALQYQLKDPVDIDEIDKIMASLARGAAMNPPRVPAAKVEPKQETWRDRSPLL
jgi:hypothetical protein